MDTQFDQTHHTVSTSSMPTTAMASDGDLFASSDQGPLESLRLLGSSLPNLTKPSQSASGCGATSTVSTTATSATPAQLHESGSGRVSATIGTTPTHVTAMKDAAATTAMSNENVATVSTSEKVKTSDQMSFTTAPALKHERIPRYALPTVASSRREAATLQTLNENVTRINRPPPKFPREPTRPKSPNFRLAARMKMHHTGRPSLPPNALTGSNNVVGQEQKPVVRRKLGATVPKSPVFRSRGPSRRFSVESVSPRQFVPTPLPSFLREQNNLPSIKLNIKTRAAMEARINPKARRATAPPPAVVKISFEPTIPKPFELGSVEQHEHYLQNLKAREALVEEEERRKRSFVANKMNPAILNGPTFVPARSSVPLTKPVDLLPFASERSERTLEYERKQRERVAQKDRDAEMARRMREEEEMLKLKLEMTKNAFKPKPVPRSHYVPHTISSRSSSEQSGFAANALSARSEARPANTTRMSAILEETSKPLEDATVESNYEETSDTVGPTSLAQEATPEKDSTAVTSPSHLTSTAGDEQSQASTSDEDESFEDTVEEPSTPAQYDEREPASTPQHGDDNRSEASKSTGTVSTGSGSTWFMQRMRKSLSPILGTSDA